MALSRRRLLMLGSLTGGLGLAGWFARSTAQAAAARIGPKGLFAPIRGDVRIVVISDLNSEYRAVTYESQVVKAVAMIPGWQPDMVLCGGDMVAGQDPFLKRERIEAMWAAFDRFIASPIRKANLPFGFTVGNHDASGALAMRGGFLFKQERELTERYWNAPEHDPRLAFVDRAGYPFYYTFQHKDIFYLTWDASTARIPPEQLAWAEKSLASRAAQSARMRIVIGHLPLYAVAVGRDEPGEVLDDANRLRAMLERYRVHTYISGHHHAYYPAHRGKLQLLHTGALGAGPRLLIEGSITPYHPLTVVDIDIASQTTTYTTYNMATLKVIDAQTLPRLLMGPTGAVLRRDIEWSELTTAEQAECMKRLGTKGCR